MLAECVCIVSIGPQKLAPVSFITESPLKLADNKFCRRQRLEQVEKMLGYERLVKNTDFSGFYHKI